ncbi:MAG: prepilin-type N-terminal cleavage/methylation domain-containing protein [Micromonosporaceae bacterium]|nr:prepilin-type N-terminal cleavage/methylation domain-containing protein [Micromonosporaceae bacterium]
MLRGLYDARDRQKGFTLVELLIVIVILGVLAAIVILAIGAFDDRGELAACKADVKSVEVAVEAYRADQGNYPASLDELTKAPGNYLREVPNTTEGSGEYWILYEPATGTVEGRLKTNEVCAGGLALATPGPSDTTGPGSGGPGGGSTTTSPGTTTSTTPGTTTSTSSGVSQPPGFPLTVQAENLVDPYYRDTLCGDWGDFLGNGSGYLSEWPYTFTIPQGYTGTYRVTVHVDSNQTVNGLRLRYRNGTSGGWTNVTTWNVGNGCNQSFTANITFSSAGTKQIQLDNANGWGNKWLLLDAVEITRIS